MSNYNQKAEKLAKNSDYNGLDLYFSKLFDPFPPPVMITSETRPILQALNATKEIATKKPFFEQAKLLAVTNKYTNRFMNN